MLRPAVVIPVKGENHKSRLAGVMDGQTREELARLLLVDLLSVIRRAGLLSSTFIVSSSEGMLATARYEGANALKEDRDRGFNSAVELAMRTREDSNEFLVLPSDLPLLKVEDLKRPLATKREGIDAVISPSRAFDGTNLLLYSRARIPGLSYDNDSFWNHVSSAARSNISLAVYGSVGIMMDLDSVADARSLLRSKKNCASLEFLRREIS